MTQSDPPRILIAGIGNVLLGDDGFGVEAARRLAQRELPPGVQVVDYGIRGLDLVYALLDPYDAVIFVDTMRKGRPPGTLYLFEPDTEASGPASLDAHGMDPAKVLALARSMGANLGHVCVVGCEPEFIPPPDSEDVVMELTPPVEAAVACAVERVISLVRSLAATDREAGQFREDRVETPIER